MGQLQREEADFSTLTGPTPSRLKVIDYVHSYPPDLMTIASLKPSVLPQHMALIRPFSDDVWLSVGLSVVAWSIILWLLSLAGSWVAGVRNVPFSTSFFYGWGAILEQPPDDPTANTSGQMLVGWWLVFCLLICTAFKSTLISHLTVQEFTKPIETMEDLVKADGWGWSVEPWLLTGIPREYFSKHTDPVVIKVYKEMEQLPAVMALKRIKKGGHSLIHFERYITIMIASYYTDSRGRTRYFISKKGFSLTSTFGWSFRIGAPYSEQFRSIMHYLEDTGITSYWFRDVVAERIKWNRKSSRLNTNDDLTDTRMEYEEREVVLGMEHVQGAFYLLIIGCVLSTMIMVLEIIVTSK